jgi:uncharacterized membrane protein
MTRGRLEAFSDGVIAILITIMVLELRIPHGDDWSALRPLMPTLLTYVLSFVNLAIYWNNHHHLLHTADHVDGRILWANTHLLFWLSLFPFTTGWMGENHFGSLPTEELRRRGRDILLLLAGVAYTILTQAILAKHGVQSKLAQAVGSDVKGKLSLALYAIAIPLAFVNHWIALGIYVVVSVMWFVPDPRIESRLAD